MNRRRIEAEAVRDAVLSISGKLRNELGGPPFEGFSYKHDHSPEYRYLYVDEPSQWRRSVYRYVVRSVPDPFMEALDCPDPSMSVAVRNETLTPLQALTLRNDAFMLRQAEYFADRLEKISPDPTTQIREAYEICYGRGASDAEAEQLVEYSRRHGLVNACRLLFNANEFIFVD